MTFDEYHAIREEAEKRWDEYLSCKGNYSQSVVRKEDNLSYWIAVVAAETKRRK